MGEKSRYGKGNDWRFEVFYETALEESLHSCVIGCQENSFVDGHSGSIFDVYAVFYPGCALSETAFSTWETIDLIGCFVENIKIREIGADVFDYGSGGESKRVFDESAADRAPGEEFTNIGIDKNKTQMIHRSSKLRGPVSWKRVLLFVAHADNIFLSDEVSFIIEEDGSDDGIILG